MAAEARRKARNVIGQMLSSVDLVPNANGGYLLAMTARAMERHVLPLLQSGRVRVPVAETFPLEAVQEAYERFAAGGKLGKIVLVMT